MKKLWIIAIFALLANMDLHAQQSLGIRGGALFSNVRVHGVSGLIPDADFIVRPEFQLLYERQLMPGLSLRTGFGYQQKGFSARASYDLDLFGIDLPVGIKAITEADYLSVPLELKWSMAPESTVSPYLFGGFNGAVATGARIREVASILVDINIGQQKINLNNSLFNRWELAGKVGLGLDIQVGNGNMFMEAAYQTGFTNLLNDPC